MDARNTGEQAVPLPASDGWSGIEQWGDVGGCNVPATCEMGVLTDWYSSHYPHERVVEFDAARGSRYKYLLLMYTIGCITITIIPVMAFRLSTNLGVIHKIAHTTLIL
jgi:hypothetical protein